MNTFRFVIDFLLPIYFWFEFSKVWRRIMPKWFQSVSLSGNFWQDFLKIFLFSIFSGSVENTNYLLQDDRLCGRSKELAIAFSSLSFFSSLVFFFLFFQLSQQFEFFNAMVAFGALALIPVIHWKFGFKAETRDISRSVVYLIGSIIWAPSFGKSILKVSQLSEPPEWIYWLSSNYLVGALIGFILSALVRLVIKKSGSTAWVGAQAVGVGVMSLGMGWGIALGDLLASYCRDMFQKSDLNRRLRAVVTVSLGIVFLLLSSEYQQLVQNFFAEYSTLQARFFQLVMMIGSFWILDLAIVSALFHFKYQYQHKGQAHDIV